MHVSLPAFADYKEDLFKKAVDDFSKGQNGAAEMSLKEILSCGDKTYKGRTLYLLGLIYLNAERFKDAEESLLKAYPDYSVLGDYVLKALFDAYLKDDRWEEAVKALKRLKGSYPDSLLLKDARLKEINYLLSKSRLEDAKNSLSSYIKSYPSDRNARFMLAKLMGETGEKTKAAEMFKDLYLEGGPLYKDALKEYRSLGGGDLGAGELYILGDNLLDRGDAVSAENAYMKALPLAEPSLKRSITLSIAQCRLKERRYHGVLDCLRGLDGPNVLSLKAKALYRLKDRDRFYKTVLSIKRDYADSPYLPGLMLLMANDMRRSNKTEEAASMLEDMVKEFPSKKETLLWSLAWLYYLDGNYKEAYGYLSRLSAMDTQHLNRYRYWQARSLEHMNGDARPIYRSLSKEEDFYGSMAMQRLGQKPHYRFIDTAISLPKGLAFERVYELKFIGMKDYAKKELARLITRIKSQDELTAIAYLFNQLGDYRRGIYLAKKTEANDLFFFTYPVCYWQSIASASERTGVDPYLILAIIREESRFDSHAVSGAGAVGLMQLMPATAKRTGISDSVPVKDRDDLFNSEKNIILGVDYFSLILKEFKEIPISIAAYNAGRATVREWLSHGNYKEMDEFMEDIPYGETKAYVKRVLESYWRYKDMADYGNFKPNLVK